MIAWFHFPRESLFFSAAQLTSVLESACWPATPSQRPKNNNHTQRWYSHTVVAHDMYSTSMSCTPFSSPDCLPHYFTTAGLLSVDPPSPLLPSHTHTLVAISISTIFGSSFNIFFLFIFLFAIFHISPFALFNVHTVCTVCTITNSHRAHMKLTIKHLQYGDFGNYRCISKNSLGETEGSIRVYGKWKIYWKRKGTRAILRCCSKCTEWNSTFGQSIFFGDKFIWSTEFQNISVCFAPKSLHVHHVVCYWYRVRTKTTTMTVRQGH